jgi:hypothetical protein
LLSGPQKMVNMPDPKDNPKQQGAGESQGGAYPNPHRGKEPEGGPDTFLGHGGQTDIDYEGPDNPNATTDETKDEEHDQ